MRWVEDFGLKVLEFWGREGLQVLFCRLVTGTANRKQLKLVIMMGLAIGNCLHGSKKKEDSKKRKEHKNCFGCWWLIPEQPKLFVA